MLAPRVFEMIGHQESKLQRFADGEVYFQLLENVRGAGRAIGGRGGQPVDQRACVAVADGRRRVGAGGAVVASGCIWRRTARLI